MHTLLTTILPVLLWFSFTNIEAGSNAETVLISEISYDKGIYYFDNRVFNGDIVDYYENEKLKFRYRVLEGRLNGEALEFYPNGKVKSKRNYVLSKLFGKFEEYYESGEIRALFEVKLNAYGSGENIEGITIGTLKKGKHKTKKYDGGVIYFVSAEGETFQSSELISILNQTKYKITDKEGEKVLLEVK